MRHWLFAAPMNGFSRLPCSSSPIRPYGQRNKDNQYANTPRDSDPDCLSIRVIENKPARRIDYLRDWLVFCECA